VSQDLDFYLQSNEGGADGELRVSIVNLVEMLMEKYVSALWFMVPDLHAI
jgi:hypothetical protein